MRAERGRADADPPCVFVWQSTRSAIGVPIDIDIEAEDPFANLFVIGDSDESDCGDVDVSGTCLCPPPLCLTSRQDVLRLFIMDKRNIVLDSAHPELAPHVVISPPSDPWEGCWAYTWNTPLPQYDGFLQVPVWYSAPTCTPSYTAQDDYPCFDMDQHLPCDSPYVASASPSPSLPSVSASPGGAVTGMLTSCLQPAADSEITPPSSYRRLYKIAVRTQDCTQ